MKIVNNSARCNEPIDTSQLVRIEKVRGPFHVGTTELIVFENGITLGEIYKEVDGYYVFISVTSCGFWEAYVLRAIADLLDKKNEKWDKKVKQELNNEKTKTKNRKTT